MGDVLAAREEYRWGGAKLERPEPWTWTLFPPCFVPYSRFTMLDLSRVTNYYVACGYTELRREIDGLAAIVMTQYGMELKEDSLFLFCGRRTDRIKVLYWSRDGYVLLNKRLSNGRFQWPRSEGELRKLDP